MNLSLWILNESHNLAHLPTEKTSRDIQIKTYIQILYNKLLIAIQIIGQILRIESK